MATEDKGRYNRELQAVKASAMYDRLMTLKPPEPPKETEVKETVAKEAVVTETERKKTVAKETVAPASKTATTHQNNCKPEKNKESESNGSEPKVCNIDAAKTKTCKPKGKSCKTVSFSETVTVKHIPIVQTPPQPNGQHAWRTAILL